MIIREQCPSLSLSSVEGALRKMGIPNNILYGKANNILFGIPNKRMT